MVEKRFAFGLGDSKLIERIIDDENVNINHMILPKGDGLPEHNANSNVYMIVAKGIVTLKLDDQDANDYPFGSIMTIPYMTKMNVSNQNDELLELFVVKSPAPKNYKPV